MQIIGSITGLSDDLNDLAELEEQRYEDQERYLLLLAIEEMQERTAPPSELVEW